jgi:autotransporter-associated beta strand protein
VAAWAIAWNGTNPLDSAVSTTGLQDKQTLFVDENLIFNSSNSTRGTATYLGNGWILTARHVIQNGSDYSTITSPGNITYQVSIGGVSQTYTADQLSTPDANSDIGLAHLTGTNSGPIATLPGVLQSQIYTGTGESGSLVQIGGYGYFGPLGTTMQTSETFNRAFNIASISGSFVDISAVGSSTLVNNGYLMGIAESGDSGSAMWMDNGAPSDTNLWDYSLIGVTDTSTGSNFGDSNQYARVRNFSGWLTSTAYATHMTVTWDTSTASGIQEGSGTWDLATANFSDGVNNVAWDNSTTQNVILGAHNGAAGTVSLGANVSVQNLMFDPATTGTYTIGPGGSFTLAVNSTTIMTANANGVITANISGGGGTVTKEGTATVTLAGTNTFTGTLSIGDGATSGGNINGALCVASSGALNGLSLVKITDNNGAFGTFQLAGNVSTPLGVPFNWNANNAGPAAMAANIIENVSGTNTIAGAITYFVGGIGYGIVSDAGTLVISGNLNPSGTSGKTFYLRGAGNGSFTGTINGSGGNVDVYDSGTWTLNSANAYTGATVLVGGVLSTNRLTNEGTGATGSTASGVGQSNNAAANLVLDGGTLSYSGSGTSTDRLFTINPGGGSIDASGSGALILSNTGSDVSANSGSHNASTMSGSMVVTVTSAGMADFAVGQVVSGTGIPTGATITGINDDTGVITLNMAATATGTTSVTMAALPRTFTLTGSSISANAFDSKLSDAAGGALSLAKSGSGSWTINSVNNYSGSTSVNAGTLTISNTGSIGGSSATVGPAGTLINNGTISTPVFGNAGVATNNNSLSVTGTVSNSGSFTNAGVLSVNGAFTNSGTATIGGTQNWAVGSTFTNAAGLATFTTDAGATPPGNLTVNMAGGVVALATPQHWANLTIAPGNTQVYAGQLDIENNHVILDYTGSDPISSIAAYVKAGFDGGLWNGPGIISSAAQANPQYGVGYADGADGVVAGLGSGEIEIKYTLLGDADLNGVVNGIDFGILAAEFNKSVTGWDQGDFDYNGIVNGLDFTALAQNFNLGASGANAASDWAALETFASANGLLADLPEPGCVGLLGVGVWGLVVRRRRR